MRKQEHFTDMQYIYKLTILVSTGYAIIQLLHWPIGFTFFTQLSNLFVAAVALTQLIRRRAGAGSRRLALWKYAATVSIVVTFLVYLLVLAPMMPGGMLAAYAQDHWASLCLHIVTPACCAADFFLNDAKALLWRPEDILWAVAPPLVWLIFILALGALGLRWHGTVAPYPFLDYSAAAGWFGLGPQGVGTFYTVLAMAGVVCLIAWGLGRLSLRRTSGE